jgi:hypothetical protein
VDISGRIAITKVRKTDIRTQTQHTHTKTHTNTSNTFMFQNTRGNPTNKKGIATVTTKFGKKRGMPEKI